MAKKSSSKSKNGFVGVTHIMFVLDESGSMHTVWDEAIGGYNAWLEGVQKEAVNTRLTLMKFDTEYRPLETDMPIAKAKPLDKTRYEPRGMTALYDAIGHCVEEITQSVAKDDRALVVILTDGHENSSREFNRQSIQSLIERLERKGNWTFTYLSASLSAFDDAAAIGIMQGNTGQFVATPQGTTDAMTRMAQSTINYANAAVGQSTGFYEPQDGDNDPLHWTPKGRNR